VVTAASASEAFPSGADRGRIDVAPARGSVRLPVLSRVKGRKTMLRLIAVTVAGFALVSSAQALTPAPLQQPDGMMTQVRLGCGPGRTRVAGICVARTTIRHTRRVVRRGYRRGIY
jgi:hypothetical protein